MGESDCRLRLAYYEASDSPRLILFGGMSGDFARFQDLLRRLSRSPGESIQVDALPFVIALDDIRLTMACCSRAEMQRRNLRLGLQRRLVEASVEFSWELTPDECEDAAELLEGFLRARIPVHQYLSTCPASDAVFVVSKGEYDADFVRVVRYKNDDIG